VNPDAVEWCSRHLAFARFEVNRLTPPLPYADRAFDLVYAFSVFTHLPQNLQLAWMRECGRVLRPDAYILFSTLGAHFVGEGRLSESERTSFESGELVVLYEGVPGSNLCSAYHPQAYVERVLAKDLEVVRFLPAADDGHHDLYLLRKPADPSV
jgi:SAM-dependent methyltransferase